MNMGKKSGIKIIAIAIVLCSVMSIFAGCGGSSENKVVIYTAAEDYRVQYLKERLKTEFPKYDVRVEYMTTGNLAAKIISEKTNTEADILYDMEYNYLSDFDQQGILADLSGKYDVSDFKKNLIRSKNYYPDAVDSVSVIMNEDVLKKKGLPEPKSYDDLLDPKYKGLISMPNPKSSGTGYCILLSRVNDLGEKNAFDYFNKLTPNILAYTDSGAGPVNALSDGEAAIGLGMTYQGVKKINEGANFKLKYFKEGSPYALYGQAIIKGKEKKPAVKEVFDFMMKKFIKENCDKFCPEKILESDTSVQKNYPTDIPYADMKNNNKETKKHLLELWTN